MGLTILDKAVNMYFDEVFEGCELSYYKMNHEWYGVGKKDDFSGMIIGHAGGDDNLWYYNGLVFHHSWSYFDITQEEFIERLVKYVEERFNVKIKMVV